MRFRAWCPIAGGGRSWVTVAGCLGAIAAESAGLRSLIPQEILELERLWFQAVTPFGDGAADRYQHHPRRGSAWPANHATCPPWHDQVLPVPLCGYFWYYQSHWTWRPRESVPAREQMARPNMTN